MNDFSWAAGWATTQGETLSPVLAAVSSFGFRKRPVIFILLFTSGDSAALPVSLRPDLNESQPRPPALRCPGPAARLPVPAPPHGHREPNTPAPPGSSQCRMPPQPLAVPGPAAGSTRCPYGCVTSASSQPPGSSAPGSRPATEGAAPAPTASGPVPSFILFSIFQPRCLLCFVFV